MGRCKGSTHPPEVRQKISDSMKGHKVSVETRIKLSHAFWKDGGRGRAERKRERRQKRRQEAKFTARGGELEYLIAEQARDDKTFQVKFGPEFKDYSPVVRYW